MLNVLMSMIMTEGECTSANKIAIFRWKEQFLVSVNWGMVFTMLGDNIIGLSSLFSK